MRGYEGVDANVATSIRATLDTLAGQLAQRPPETWAGWVAYLLETFEDVVDEAGMAGLLVEVQDAISDRLETGRWNGIERSS